MNLLVIAFRALGDMVLITPVVRALRQRADVRVLTLLVDSSGAEVFARNPWVDHVIVFDRVAHRTHGWADRLGADLAVVRDLRARRYDVVVDLFSGPRSAWLAWLSGAPVRYGQRVRGWAWLYTHPIAVTETGRHLVEQKLDLVRPLVGDGQVDLSLELVPTKEECEWAEQALRGAGADLAKPLIGLFPGGGWGHKCWPAERFAELADRLAGEADIVVVGGVRDAAACRAVAARMNRAPIVFDNVASLRQTMALIDRTTLFVSNDTGPMHVAVALGRPTIALFGPSDVTKYGPWGANGTLIRHALPCSPCPQQEDTCHRHGRVRQECMTLIMVDEVEAAVRRLLQKPVLLATVGADGQDSVRKRFSTTRQVPRREAVYGDRAGIAQREVRDRVRPKVDASVGVHERALALLVDRGGSDRRVLDAPCGEGAIAHELLDQGYHPVCGDIEPSGFKVPGLVCEQVDLNRQLPFAANSFDAWVCIEGIEHIENPHQLIREARRILRPGGQFVISTPNTLSIKSRYYTLRFGYPVHFDLMVKREQPINGGMTVKHINPVSFIELRFLLEEYGFTITRVETNRFEPRHRIRQSLISRLFVRRRPMRNDTPIEARHRSFLGSRTLMYGEILIVEAVKT